MLRAQQAGQVIDGADVQGAHADVDDAGDVAGHIGPLPRRNGDTDLRVAGAAGAAGDVVQIGEADLHQLADSLGGGVLVVVDQQHPAARLQLNNLLKVPVVDDPLGREGNRGNRFLPAKGLAVFGGEQDDVPALRPLPQLVAQAELGLGNALKDGVQLRRNGLSGGDTHTDDQNLFHSGLLSSVFIILSQREAEAQHNVSPPEGWAGRQIQGDQL